VYIETTDAPSGPAPEMPYSRHCFQSFFIAFFFSQKSVMFYFRIVLCFVYETFDFISQQLVKSTILYCKMPSGLTTKQRLVQLVDA